MSKASTLIPNTTGISTIGDPYVQTGTSAVPNTGQPTIMRDPYTKEWIVDGVRYPAELMDRDTTLKQTATEVLRKIRTNGSQFGNVIVNISRSLDVIAMRKMDDEKDTQTRFKADVIMFNVKSLPPDVVMAIAANLYIENFEDAYATLIANEITK